MGKSYLICYFAAILLVYLFDCRGGGVQNLNNNSQKGFFVEKRWLQRLLRIEKDMKFISYTALIFVLIGFLYILAIIPCVIISFFVSDLTAKWIAFGHLGIVIVTWFVLMGLSVATDRKKREKWM